MKSNLTKLALLATAICLSSNALGQDWTGATETLYFDFDRSANTTGVDTTRIKEALQSCDVNSLSITGHTDSSGNAQYNQELSEKRAEVIKAEVASWGLLRGEAISTRGAGENELAIYTGDGVKEDLNRRAEIQFGFSQPCSLYYTAPAPAPLETIIYEAPAETVVYQAPVTPTPAPTPVVSTPTPAPTPVVSTPAPAPTPVPAPAPVVVPTASSGVNVPLIILGGIASIVAIDEIISDDDDDEPTSP